MSGQAAIQASLSDEHFCSEYSCCRIYCEFLSVVNFKLDLPNGGDSPVNSFCYATEMNIKRFQNLLETSVDDTERQVIQNLLAEEKARAVMQAREPDRVLALEPAGRQRGAARDLR